MKKKLTLNVEHTLIKEAKKRNINLSVTMEHALAERLGVKVAEGFMPDLILKVKCPKCHAIRNTSTLKRVTCFKCGFVYRVYPKDDISRVVKIIKGTKALLFEKARFV